MEHIRLSRHSGASCERGQNLIEFAIVLPVLLLVLMGIIDFGFMLKTQTDLSRANMAGARSAAFSASDDDVNTSILLSVPSSFDTSRMSISLTRESQSPERGTEVTVTATYIYKSITPLPFVSDILDGKQLTSSTTVRVE